MKCQTPFCNKEINLCFKLKNNNCVCENCALINGMSEKEINSIKKESESV